MRYDLRDPSSRSIDAALAFYGENGYLLLDGLSELATCFHDELARLIGVDPDATGPLLDARHPPEELPPETLRSIARVVTPEWIKGRLLRELEPLLVRALGGFVQVSRDYHIQFKSGQSWTVNHGGSQAGHREVQGIHLVHQDFCGASRATSPSAVTLWVPLNDCDEWTLRVFPGAHKRGMLQNTFLEFDDPRLETLGEPVDIRARRGTGAIFNALMPHGSSNPSRARRVSCDIRFFPLTAFLPSEIRTLTDRPLEAHRRGLERAESDAIRAPFLEALAFLGQPPVHAPASGPGPLHWVDHLNELIAGDRVGARRSFEAFISDDVGVDEIEAYDRFFDGTLHSENLQRLRTRLGRLEPHAPELEYFDRWLGHLSLQHSPSEQGAGLRAAGA
jgi:hypothetical protein